MRQMPTCVNISKQYIVTFGGGGGGEKMTHWNNYGICTDFYFILDFLVYFQRICLINILHKEGHVICLCDYHMVYYEANHFTTYSENTISLQFKDLSLTLKGYLFTTSQEIHLT